MTASSKTALTHIARLAAPSGHGDVSRFRHSGVRRTSVRALSDKLHHPDTCPVRNAIVRHPAKDRASGSIDSRTPLQSWRKWERLVSLREEDSMRALTRTACLVPYVGALLASTAIPASADMSSAVRTTSQQAKGLQAPAEIIVDHWGIPHIYTANQRDAFFLQGYNAARDRLWQIDLWRKRGLGLLAKDFGAKYVDQDRAARMFLYRGDMDKEWAAYGPYAKSYTEAFVEGVNAFAQEVRDGTRPTPGPLEARGRGPHPQPWPDAQCAIRGQARAGRLR